MTDIAQQNLQILARRWPALAERIFAHAPPDGMQWEGDEQHPTLSIRGYRLWSAVDSNVEARLQARMIPEDASEAWVYGIGSGDLVRELLKRRRLERLHVLPMNLGLAHFLMHSLDNRDWLSDPRVALLDPAREDFVRSPFAAIPPCLSLRDDDLRDLYDQLVNALIRPFEESRQAARTPMRRQHIEANRDFIENDGDVAELFDTAPGSTAFVCAAGPTLSETATWLSRHRDQGILIVVDGALSPLIRLGLVPDYVLSLDDNPETIIRYFEGDLSACTDRTLIYTPIVDHAPLQRWPGKRLTMYTGEGIYDELRKTYPKADLFVSGSVTHPCVDLAVRMGARKIMLFGVDFGFPGEQIHANSDAPVAFYSDAAKAGTTTIDGRGNTIRTLASFNRYRLGLEKYIYKHPEIDFVNMSRDGALIRGTRFADEATK